MQIEVFNPTGATRSSTSFAPRLDTIAGKTIGLLSNRQWQAGRTLPFLGQLLTERDPSIKLVAAESDQGIDKASVIDGLVAAGCDAVIVGHAA